jgi:L-methionine (R)-S-oxide reductase
MDASLFPSLSAELNGQGTSLAKMLNALSMVKEVLGGDSWVGLYLYNEKNNTLDLGPFQGSPACESIQLGKGVVGASYATKNDIYVPEVDRFPGYISCDPAVKSEAVFPVVYRNRVIAIFDVDSTKKDGLKRDLVILRQIADLIGSFGFLLTD